VQLGSILLIHHLLSSANDVRREFGIAASDTEGLYARQISYGGIVFYMQPYYYGRITEQVVTGIRIHDPGLLSVSDITLNTSRNGIVAALGEEPAWEGVPLQSDRYLMQYMICGDPAPMVLSFHFDDPSRAAVMATIHFYDDGRTPMPAPWWLPGEPISVFLGDTIISTNEFVFLSINWANGTRTMFSRWDDSDEWTMYSRDGSTSSVDPSFWMEGSTLVISFPTTSRLYYLYEDYTGRFGDETFSWYAYIG